MARQGGVGRAQQGVPWCGLRPSLAAAERPKRWQHKTLLPQSLPFVSQEWKVVARSAPPAAGFLQLPP